jgi:hypothetical protein
LGVLLKADRAVLARGALVKVAGKVDPADLDNSSECHVAHNYFDTPMFRKN